MLYSSFFTLMQIVGVSAGQIMTGLDNVTFLSATGSYPTVTLCDLICIGEPVFVLVTELIYEFTIDA